MDIRPCHGAANQFLAVPSTMMAQFLHTRFVSQYIFVIGYSSFLIEVSRPRADSIFNFDLNFER